MKGCRPGGERAPGQGSTLGNSIVVLLSLLAAGCGNLFHSDQRVAVHDVRRPEVLILRRQGGEEHVHGITIAGSGSIEGEASVSLLLNGKPHRTAKLSGRTAFTWTNDWYADTAEIRYEPKAVRGGHLRFRVAFHTL